MTLGPSGSVLLVDLSNLCRDERLLVPGLAADLGILDQLREAVASSEVVEVRQIRAVADRSLIGLLPAEQRRRFRELERSGEIEVSALADERLLALAFDDAAGSVLIASLDHFDDFRRAYPTIQGSTDRFLGWDIAENGSISLYFRDMEVHDHHRLSRKEESAELKARRLRRDSLVGQAVSNYFRCSNAECLVAQLWPERIPQLPRYDDRSGAFVCPSCGGELTEVGSRPRAVQLIVYLHGVERLRLLVSDGERLELGRRHAKRCFGLDQELGEAEVASVSRRHVAVQLDGAMLYVEDLGSRNGSVLRRRGEDVALTKGQRVAFGPRDVVALPSGITIDRSGREHPIAAQSGSSLHAEPSPDERSVTLLRRRP